MNKLLSCNGHLTKYKCLCCFRINVCPYVSFDLSHDDTDNCRVTCARPIGQWALEVMIDQCLELMDKKEVGGIQRITFLLQFDVHSTHIEWNSHIGNLLIILYILVKQNS
jgi:hypothetical protein